MVESTGFGNEVQKYAPWRRGVAWWVVLIQGLLLLGIGGYALWDTSSAARIIIFGLGIYLVAIGLGTIVQAMRGRGSGLSVFGLLAAGGGLVAGISVSLLYLVREEGVFAPGFFIFGVALITVGVLTLLAAFVERPEAGIVWATLLRGVIWIGLGSYLVYAILSGQSEPDLVRWIAIGLLVLGALLAFYSIVLNRQQASREAKREIEPAIDNN
jgi:uncharacterized membrane protein HdeD (DUF308 family)